MANTLKMINGMIYPLCWASNTNINHLITSKEMAKLKLSTKYYYYALVDGE